MPLIISDYLIRKTGMSEIELKTDFMSCLYQQLKFILARAADFGSYAFGNAGGIVEKEY